MTEFLFNSNKNLDMGSRVARVGTEAGFALLIMTIAYFIRYTLTKTFTYQSQA